MKKALLIVAIVVAGVGGGVTCPPAYAQGIARVTGEIATPAAGSGAQVVVRMTDDAARAVQAADRNAAITSVVAYGVRIYNDSSQDGRENALAAKARFEELFPGIEAAMSYEIPSFLVTAGHFIDRVDAVALCGRAMAQFRNAFVVKLEVPVAAIIEREAREAQEAQEKIFAPEVENQE